MTSRPRAFFAIDQGTATTSAALIGRVGGRWRLLGSTAFPTGVALDTILGLLVERLRAADRGLADSLGTDSGPGRSAGIGRSRHRDRELVDLAMAPAADLRAFDWPRLIARTSPPATLAILAPTERRRSILERAATSSGWRVESASLERVDALGLTTLALRHDIKAVLLGSGGQASSHERRGVEVLGPLLEAVAERRPELPIVLAGAAAQLQAGIEARRHPPAGPVIAVREGGGAVPSEPALREALDGLRVAADDSRRGVVRATASLASVLDRRVETIEVGHSAGARAAAGRWLGRDDEPPLRSAIVAAAGLAQADPDDALLDGVAAWSSVLVDRRRLRDRLRELWLAPWAEAHGEGALLRLTAARAALGRLVAATPEFADLPSPDLVVVAGGVWSVAPPPAVALAVIDLVRRPGVSQLVLDHARLLGPIGTIADEDECRAVLADLVDDAFVPLGTVIMPHGLKGGRYVGRAVVHRGDGPSVEHELVAGRLVTLDVPPGESGAAELVFRDAVVLGGRGRRFAIDVAGGMGGVLVDLRDVPLRLPDRPERLREVLTAWQQPLWNPLESRQ